MKDHLRAVCSECGGEVRFRTIKQEFEREVLHVLISGIHAQVCAKCGATYFTPGGAQALVEAVNSLFSLARRNQQHKGKLSAAV